MTDNTPYTLCDECDEPFWIPPYLTRPHNHIKTIDKPVEGFTMIDNK